jgi:transposase
VPDGATLVVSGFGLPLWRRRYGEKGVAGLPDVRRSGRSRSIDHAKIVTVTLTSPPKNLGITHWLNWRLAQR